MKLDEEIDHFVAPPHPKNAVFDGRLVNLQPLSVKHHCEDLFAANSLDEDAINWTYLPYGPFASRSEYANWLANFEDADDPCFFAIVRKSDGKAVGIASYLRINPSVGSIEVGHIHYSPLLQNTTEATEAMYLMMKWVFDSGYRRYEWKCNALNVKSRKAAQRLGFSYEGVFRQMTIEKCRNRNTAWFAAIDKEWEMLSQCFLTYLSTDNFGQDRRPIVSLSSLTRNLLYKTDNLEFC